MLRHAEAIDCRDCEDLLQLGIDAFKWLGRADRVIRSAVYRGLAEYDPSLDVALAALYAEWLKPCTFAEGWIAQQEQRGFRVDNLAEFPSSCCEEVRAIVEAHEGTLENDALVELRNNAIDAHRRGETLEPLERGNDRRTREFLAMFAALPSEVQKLARDAYKLFVQNPEPPLSPPPRPGQHHRGGTRWEASRSPSPCSTGPST